jgi:hypothetical protein
MQYMITWNERQQGSPIEYENAQKRILEVFGPWKAPANFKIQSFVIRVGDWGSEPARPNRSLRGTSRISGRKSPWTAGCVPQASRFEKVPSLFCLYYGSEGNP